MMLINVIHKGQIPYSGSNNNFAGVSLSDFLFTSILEKYIVYDICGLTFPSFESSSVFYITPTDSVSMQE